MRGCVEFITFGRETDGMISLLLVLKLKITLFLPLFSLPPPRFRPILQ